MAKAVEAMDFEYFLCSHGALGKKADVTANIRYREDLKAAVAKAIAAGQTLEAAQKSVTMDAYKDWEFYEQQRPQNVAGMYRALTAKINSVTSPLIAGSAAVLVCEAPLLSARPAPLQGWRVTFNSRRC